MWQYDFERNMLFEQKEELRAETAMGRALLVARYALKTDNGDTIELNVATSHFESLDMEFSLKAR
mgnify:CR=1 FL=1